MLKVNKDDLFYHVNDLECGGHSSVLVSVQLSWTNIKLCLVGNTTKYLYKWQKLPPVCHGGGNDA
jgi:hypothetical protein